MRRNGLKAKVHAGQKTWGVAFASKSLPMVELVAKLGFDYVFLDAEHGVLSLQDIEEMCIVADGVGLSTVARVPRLDAGTILQFLERGVMGIRAPHTSTKEDVEALVQYSKFPPDGIRSFSSSRAAEYECPSDIPEYMARVNAEVMPIAMLEDEEALKNLPAILTVTGLDVFTIGPYDLAQSMGEASPDSPAVVAAMQRAIGRIRAANKIYERDYMNRIDALELFKNGAQEYLAKQRGK
jgi:2-keto-3-deoxy-L-rhamnonate aldolase RhmA